MLHPTLLTEHATPSPPPCAILGAGVEQSAPPAAATPAGGKSPSIPAVLGTMSIPEPLDTVAAREALEYFHAAGFDEIDTAILYQDGATETTLGTHVRAPAHVVPRPPQVTCGNTVLDKRHLPARVPLKSSLV